MTDSKIEKSFRAHEAPQRARKGYGEETQVAPRTKLGREAREVLRDIERAGDDPRKLQQCAHEVQRLQHHGVIDGAEAAQLLERLADVQL